MANRDNQPTESIANWPLETSYHRLQRRRVFYPVKLDNSPDTRLQTSLSLLLPAFAVYNP